MVELAQLDALGPAGAYRARARLTVTDVTGIPVAELSLVPRLFVARGLAAMRKSRTMPAGERVAALVRAGHAFATEVINGVSAEDYQHAVSRVSGLPLSVVRGATHAIAEAASEAYAATQCAKPDSAVTDWRDPLTRRGRAVWTRRGDVFAVHAAGNHPGVNAQWLEAVALGYRTAVRPSRREPFTPHRLVTALRMAGFDHDQLLFLPTDHTVAADIIRSADLALVYGSDAVVNRYASDPTVLPQGPGRSKILLTGDAWTSHLDTIVDSVSRDGGTACVNATAVFVEGDPTPVAEAIAERLSALPSLPPSDEKAVLPVQPLDVARRIDEFLSVRAAGTVARLGGDGVADNLGDGSAVLRPAVFQVPDPHAPQLGTEMPFPCVWVAPWTRADGIEPLRNTLALTAITSDQDLTEKLVNEPTISKVYTGDNPTHWVRPGIPHDGYLAEFLMRTKAVLRG